MAAKNYIKMGIPVLTVPIDITGLGIVTGVFKYIKPNKDQGYFTGLLDAQNSVMTYQLENVDIDIEGEWSIWAYFTDGSGRTGRGDTTKIYFYNSEE